MGKRIFILLVAGGLLTACSSTRQAATPGRQAAAERKVAAQIAIRKAIEARKFVIRVDRIIPSGGNPVDLVPRHNFIIINGELASISLAYIGRSFGTRQITGININGRTGKYQMKVDEEKGFYDLHIEVLRGNDRFDLYLSMGEGGHCTISLNNSYLQSVRYHGTIEPLAENPARVRAVSGTRL